VQRNSLLCLDGGGHLRALIAADPDNVLSDAQLDAAFDAGWFVRHVDVIYRRFGV
jgi:adenylosuccinate lyase